MSILLINPLHRNIKSLVQRGDNMGKNKLPIDSFRDIIVETIKKNSVTIITAETGAGKSTQVPQYLLEEGYEVIVTQPRRLAARSVAARVASERGEMLGGTIGYRTAVDRVDSSLTKCLFCTDGLALVRELLGQNKGKVLVLDEVHEWNENIEVLVSWVKSQVINSTSIKVVLMSATLESEKLSEFFGGAPIISVPGRTFPVVEMKKGDSVVEDVVSLVNEGRNVLVFMPGVQEIAETITALEAKKVDAIILPLHGQLEPNEQARCFAHYGKPKVVISTNVAQTSVTIDDIDAVVDGGTERRIELVDGVEGLYLKPISLADAKQRKGRAGRVKDGIYIDHCPSYNRSEFPVAEILRKRLDQTVLRLAIAGFDMETMEFFHQPSISDIHDAHETLVGLGCMESDGKVTKIGKLVNQLPVSVKYGRMLIEANRLGVVADVLTAAAILEVGGITVPPPSDKQPDRPDWRKFVDERESDVLGQITLWQKTRSMNERQMKEAGVSLRNFFRAKEIRQSLSEALRAHYRLDSNGKRENILKAVASGMVDHLYRCTGSNYQNGDNTRREMSSGSVLKHIYAEWIVGVPFDLQIQTRRGSMTLNLVTMGSKVDPQWLVELAPQLVTVRVEDPYWNREGELVVENHVTSFNDQEIARESKPAKWSKKSQEVMSYALRNSYTSSDVMSEIKDSNSSVIDQYRKYRVRSGGTIPEKDSDILMERYLKILEAGKILSLAQFLEITDMGSLRLKLSDLISAEEVSKIETENPAEIIIKNNIYPVSYHYEYNGNFYSTIKVEDELFLETLSEGDLILPSGGEVRIIFDGYIRTLSEHIKVIQKLLQERSERERKDLVQNFERQISEFTSLPLEVPFCSYKRLPMGDMFVEAITALKEKMISGLTVENFDERVQLVRTEAQEINTELRTRHSNAKALINEVEGYYQQVMATTDYRFVSNEAEEVKKYLGQCDNLLAQADFAEFNELCEKASQSVSELARTAQERKEERDELVKSNNIPEYLLEAFNNDVERALGFMRNVAKIETWRLDEHELSSGRARARAICQGAWEAMNHQGDDFFCGADPNDVKYYVYDQHFGEDAVPVVRVQEGGSYNKNLSIGNDAMGDALRKAGLLK